MSHGCATELYYCQNSSLQYSKEYEFYSAVVDELNISFGAPGIMECQHTDSDTDYGGSNLRRPQQV